MSKESVEAALDILERGIDTGVVSERQRIRAVTNPPADEFLEWVAARFVNHYGESEHTDYVEALRRLAAYLKDE